MHFTVLCLDCVFVHACFFSSHAKYPSDTVRINGLAYAPVESQATVKPLTAGLGAVSLLRCASTSKRNSVFCVPQELTFEVSRIKILVYRVILHLCFENWIVQICRTLRSVATLIFVATAVLVETYSSQNPKTLEDSKRFFPISFLVKSIKLCNLNC